MTNDLKLKRLRGYPEEARFSQAYLRKAVLYLPWHLNTVVRKAELKLVSLMQRAAASWQTLALSLGCPPETTVRNLIAAAKLEDLPTYRLILRWARTNDIHPFNNGFAEVEKMLPDGTSLHRIVESILYNREKPSEADLIDFFRNYPQRLVTIILNNYRSHSLSFKELLSITIRLCGNQNPRYASAALGILLEIKRRRKLQPWMDERELIQLPQLWRRSILFSSARRSAFLLNVKNNNVTESTGK